MIFDKIDFILKDNRRINISSPTYDDIQGMIDLLKQDAYESIFVMPYPEECDGNTPEKEKAIFDRVNNSDNELVLLAREGNKVIACTHLSFGSYIKTKHRCFVTIQISKEYWGQGLGTKLFEELIKVAETKKDITQMELSFIEGNTRAQALYEKMGFVIVGKKPNAIRLKDGSLLSMIEMVKDIKQ